MLRYAFLLTAILLTVSGFLLASSGAQKQDARLLWSTTLRQPERPATGFDSNSSHEARRQIAFGSANEFVVLDDGPTSGTLHEARAFVLDAASGRVTHERIWMTMGWPYIFATADGGYVVVTDKGMDSYSAGLDHIRASSPEAAREASPDGSIIAAWSSTLRPGHGLTLFLDTMTLKPSGTEVLDTAVVSISRDHTASTGVRQNTTNQTIEYRPEDDQFPLYDTTCPSARPRFISNRIVAIFGCGRVQVISTHGDRLFEAELEGEPCDLAAVARDGSRFASYCNYTRGHWSKLQKEVFTVFDVWLKRAVSSVVVKALHGAEMRYSGAALSPDGSLLAVNSAGVVHLYAVPEE